MINQDQHISIPLINDSLIVPRRSYKRRWSSLSRFQKNLILTLIASILLLSCFLLMPSANVETDNTNKKLEHIQIGPFKENHDNHPLVAPLHSDGNNPLVVESQIDETLANRESNRINRDHETSSNSAARGYVAAPGHNNVADQQDKQVPKPDNFLRSPVVVEVTPNWNETAKDFKGPQNTRQTAVVEAFKHSWKGYKEFAWGHDNLKPISMGYSDWFGLGLTLVDALDTMYIMDLTEEFDEARNWIDQYLSFNINKDVNLFEVTIRVLGGLLSAFHLSGDQMFLRKATDLGNRLLPCFDSPSGIPFSDVNLGTMIAHSPKWSPDSSTSEVTTIQLEFRDLSRCTGNMAYENAAVKVNEKVHLLEKNQGLVPIFINANTGQFRNFATISLGARADSYYEYLFKQWLQTGKKEDDDLIEDYKLSMEGVMQQLMKTTPNEHHVYIGELINGKADFKPKMDHLTCFLPGTLILGHKHGMPASHLKLAQDLLETCYQTYVKQPTGLAPEITYYNLNGESESDIYVKSNDAHNLLRPEFVESLYYFYAITGNRTYQDMGWRVFEAFNKYTRVTNGYTSIGNVKNAQNTRPRDMMESFWLGETLKYFYLLFSDDRQEVDLDKYVFNTEGHPLPIRSN